MKTYVITEEQMNLILEQNALGRAQATYLNDTNDKVPNDQIVDSFNRIENILENEVVESQGDVKWRNWPPPDGTELFDNTSRVIGRYRDDPKADYIDDEEEG